MELITDMKKIKLRLPLLTLFLLCQISLFAQNPAEIQCTMNLDQIALAQSFDIDHPNQEGTRIIASDIISELHLVYDLVSQNSTVGLEEHLQAIEASINSAELLGMNYSMFQADLDFIETLN